MGAVDLGQSFEIHVIAMWHDHRYVQSFRDVVLQSRMMRSSRRA